jgi:hypothetical protein
VHYSSRCSTTNGPHTDSIRSPVHFANRASVILRTPLHVYHNLVFFTVAFVVPPTEPDTKAPGPDFCASNLWFVGAFGGWWKGGTLYSWWVDAVARSKDEEGVSSGVLSVKSLDNMNEYDGVCKSTFNESRSLLSQVFLFCPSRHSRPKKSAARLLDCEIRKANYLIVPRGSRKFCPLVALRLLPCRRPPHCRFTTFNNHHVRRPLSRFTHHLSTLSRHHLHPLQRALTSRPS